MHKEYWTYIATVLKRRVKAKVTISSWVSARDSNLEYLGMQILLAMAIKSMDGKLVVDEDEAPIARKLLGMRMHSAYPMAFCLVQFTFQK